MILAFDTSSAACTAALFDGSGACVGRRDEQIGRGHSERLVPMIAELLNGQAATTIIVGVGLGSFTGVRVGIAAAHGLAIGWDAELAGMSSLALLAASASGQDVTAAVVGGHGELFFQAFDAAGRPTSEIRNLKPGAAAAEAQTQLVVGSGAQQLVDLRGWGEARAVLPTAADAMRLAEGLRSLQPKPVYARAPDARVREAA